MESIYYPFTHDTAFNFSKLTECTICVIEIFKEVSLGIIEMAHTLKRIERVAV